MQTSDSSLKGVATCFFGVRKAMQMALTPTTSRQVRTHRPQRMQRAAGSPLVNRVSWTPMVGGHFLDDFRGGAWARSSSSTMRREARTFSDSGLDHQSGFGRIGAGIHQAGAGRVADFHHAQAAVAFGFQLRVVAQGGDVDAIGLGLQKDRGPRRNLDRFSVDGQIYYIVFHNSTLTASNLQTSWHMPHLMQIS